MVISISSVEDVEDLVLGATILGTGGGGSPELGKEILMSDLAKGRKLTIKSLHEISGDSLLVSPYSVGSIAASNRPRKTALIGAPFECAIRILEETLSRKVGAIIPCEIGGGNTATALHIASKLGIPLVDGDLVGRAAPELCQSTLHIFHLPAYPAVLASETGNVVIIKRYASMEDYEVMARSLAVLCGGMVSVIDSPLDKAIAEKVLIQGTVSNCLNIGRVVRRARDHGKDVVEATKSVLDGWNIFEGCITCLESEDRGGFLFADVVLKGIGNSGGHSFRSWIKNEHIIGWVDGKPAVMPPDLIIFIGDDGLPITNDRLEMEIGVRVLGAKAPQIWRTSEGLCLFGPRRFGFDYDYTPIELLIK